MKTIRLPDGYSGDYVECEWQPIMTDRNLVKLHVKDSCCTRWVHHDDWQKAYWKSWERDEEDW